MLGVAPLGMIFGALAIGAHLSTMAAQAMSSVIFAGSAQYIAAQLLGSGASGAVILLVVFVLFIRRKLRRQFEKEISSNFHEDQQRVEV